jgi:hypothetical protein
MGAPDVGRRHLLVSARGPGDRRLRTFSQEKAKAMLSEDRVRVEPFTTSILDGIDIRETIRNWHQRKIYVRQADRLAGDVGAVVVIFDEDSQDRYQYLTTWLGEHQNESDMAFYSTFPFDHLVGPGIGRAEYGGFLMTLPPRRLYDVWSDPDLRIRRVETGAAVDGRAGLFGGAVRGVCRRETSALRFSARSPRIWGARFCMYRSARSRRQK